MYKYVLTLYSVYIMTTTVFWWDQLCLSF